MDKEVSEYNNPTNFSYSNSKKLMYTVFAIFISNI